MENGTLTPAQKEMQMHILEAQIRECFRRVVYSHKTHEKCADQVLRLHQRIKFLLVVLSAITTTSIMAKISREEDQWPLYVGAVLSTLLFGLNAYTKDYDLGEISQKHKNAANAIWNIREKYLSLLTEMKMGMLTPEQIIKRRDELQQELNTIYAAVPRTDSRAYRRESDSIGRMKKGVLNGDEVDPLLPEELRTHAAGPGHIAERGEAVVKG